MAKSIVDIQDETSPGMSANHIRVIRQIRVSLLQFAVHPPEGKS